MPRSTSVIIDGFEHISRTPSPSQNLTPSSDAESEFHGWDAATTKLSSSEKEECDESGVLRIVYSACPPPMLERKLELLHGTLPEDIPLETNATYAKLDLRKLPPLTIRYVDGGSRGCISSNLRQDQVIEALWSRVDALLSNHVISGDRPGVVFDYLTRDGVGYLTIDLTFSTVDVFLVVRDNLREIQVGADVGSLTSFVQDGWCNTLPGRLIPIDILQIPIDEAASEKFLKALKHKFSRAGQVVGVGAMFLTSSYSWQESESDVPLNIVRAYVKLNHEAMTLDSAEYSKLLPTHMRWKGMRYNLCWPGMNLRNKHVDGSEGPEAQPVAEAEAAEEDEEEEEEDDEGGEQEEYLEEEEEEEATSFAPEAAAPSSEGKPKVSGYNTHATWW